MGLGKIHKNQQISTLHQTSSEDVGLVGCFRPNLVIFGVLLLALLAAGWVVRPNLVIFGVLLLALLAAGWVVIFGVLLLALLAAGWVCF